MLVLIMAKPSVLDMLKTSVCSLGTAFCAESLQISTDISDVSKADALFADEYGLDFLIDQNLHSNSFLDIRVFVLFKGILLDANNKNQFELLEDSIKEREQWIDLKNLNELKIKLNILFRNSEFSSYPSFIQLELTDVCNAECIMCSHLFQKNNDAGFLSEDGFKSIKPLLPYAKVAMLHGNGEPFLHPQLFDILHEYTKYKVLLSTSTNLSVFNDSIAACLNECFFDIRVSCDGCTKEIYEQIRRKLSFDKLIANLEMLHELCHDLRKILLVVIMRQNIHQLDEFIPFAKKYGFSEIVFSNMTPSITLGNEEDDPLCFKSAVKYKLEQAVILAKEAGIRVIYPDCYGESIDAFKQDIKPTFRSDDEIEQQRRRIQNMYHLNRAPLERLRDCSWNRDQIPCKGICSWCVEKAYFDLHGNLSICCINNRYSLGNIIEDEFYHIWNGIEMQSVRQMFFEGKLPDFCEGCHFILNHSLPFLKEVEVNEQFFARRSISKLYRETFEKR